MNRTTRITVTAAVAAALAAGPALAAQAAPAPAPVGPLAPPSIPPMGPLLPPTHHRATHHAAPARHRTHVVPRAHAAARPYRVIKVDARGRSMFRLSQLRGLRGASARTATLWTLHHLYPVGYAHHTITATSLLHGVVFVAVERR